MVKDTAPNYLDSLKGGENIKSIIPKPNKNKLIIIAIATIIITLSILYRINIDKSDYPSTPEEVIREYLIAHGNTDRKALEIYISDKRREELSRPNVFRATEPIFKSFEILSIDEVKKDDPNYSRDNNIKVYYAVWNGTLTEYGKKYYTKPEGRMDSYFWLIKDNKGRWKIDECGY